MLVRVEPHGVARSVVKLMPRTPAAQSADSTWLRNRCGRTMSQPMTSDNATTATTMAPIHRARRMRGLPVAGGMSLTRTPTILECEQHPGQERINVLKLAAFADEISPNLDEQIRVCRE